MNTRNSLLALTLCLGLQAAHAAKITVGSCRPHQRSSNSYSTISAAIAAARPGDQIDVCPGTYPEQLTITKSISLQGIVLPDQPGATITPPAAGLQQLPAGSSFYPQVYVDHAGGPVTLSNLAIDGASANILYGTIVFDSTSACEVGLMKDFSGISFTNTPGYIQNVSVAGHFLSSFYPGDPEPQQYPDCGSGIEFNNRTEPAIVTNSVVTGFGFIGISSTGPLTASRNILTTQSGPYQVGIQATSRSVILNNTISGEAFFTQTTGIQGAGLVQDNMVQGFTLGIVNSGQVVHNTLFNNYTGITDPNLATENLVSTTIRQYMDPACAGGACGSNPTSHPTIGVDMACAQSNQVLGNGFVGVGIGVANVKKNDLVPASNLYANVGTTSTACAQ
jgi:hypothetical protein